MYVPHFPKKGEANKYPMIQNSSDNVGPASADDFRSPVGRCTALIVRLKNDLCTYLVKSVAAGRSQDVRLMNAMCHYRTFVLPLSSSLFRFHDRRCWSADREKEPSARQKRSSVHGIA